MADRTSAELFGCAFAMLAEEHAREDRLRTALADIIVASERGSASDAIQDMLDIARAASEQKEDSRDSVV